MESLKDRVALGLRCPSVDDRDVRVVLLGDLGSRKRRRVDAILELPRNVLDDPDVRDADDDLAFRFVDDSLEGIAAALNCSVGTVKSRLFHALERLRAIHPEQNESQR